jgi:hypothetical protein
VTASVPAGTEGPSDDRGEPGVGVFKGDGAGIEDALTLLIMADKRVGKDIHGKVYSGDWADFAAKTEAWHGQKRRRGAGS